VNAVLKQMMLTDRCKREHQMNAIRWILTGLGLLFFLLCFAATIAASVRWIRTGKRGSGLPIVGSIAAAAGIMAAPIGARSQRIGIACIPFAIEAVTYLVLTVMGKSKRASD
jgi:hypothetical protein